MKLKEQFKNDILDDDFLDTSTANKHERDPPPFFESIHWWESKRLKYNVALIIILFFATILAQETLLVGIAVGIFTLIGANICYTIGWWGEMILQYYFKRVEITDNLRSVLMILGVSFSIFVILNIFNPIFW